MKLNQEPNSLQDIFSISGLSNTYVCGLGKGKYCASMIEQEFLALPYFTYLDIRGSSKLDTAERKRKCLL